MRNLPAIATLVLVCTVPFLSDIDGHRDVFRPGVALLPGATWTVSLGDVTMERLGTGSTTVVAASGTTCASPEWRSAIRQLATTHAVLAIVVATGTACR